MGLTFSSSRSDADASRSNLKLEAQKIKEFSGSYDEWQRWKSRTECAFDGSGYENILVDPVFATNNPRMNRVVYSQLAVATVDGTAYHLVRQFEELKDGHEAWNALCGWFDRDQIRNETLESLRSKLDSLKLHNGTTASQYVNKFLMWQMELDKIPGEGYSESHAVYLFLKNILDTDYDTTVTYLRNNGSDLSECINTIWKAERDLLRKRSDRRKMKNMIRRNKHDPDCISEDDVPNDRRLPRKRGSSDNGGVFRESKTQRLTGNITKSEKGFISIPYNDWKNLADDEQALVQEYNAWLKHGESTDDIKWPDGVIFVKKTRRVGKEKPEDQKKNKEGEPEPRKKKISFHIGKEADVKDEES